MSKFSFMVVDQFTQALLPKVKVVFEKMIKPLYGDQTRAIRKVAEGYDRLCEMMLVDGEPKGLIVYKKKPTNNALELKTLCLLEPEKDSKKGYGSKLYERVIEVTKSRGIEKIAVSVSSERPQAKNFFERKSLTVKYEKKGLYKDGVTEYFMEGALSHAAATMPLPELGKPKVEAPAIPRRAVVSRPIESKSSVAAEPAIKKSDRKRQRDEPTQAAGAGAAITATTTPDRAPRKMVKVKSKRPPKHHRCTLKNIYIEQIRSGKKKFEGRVNNHFFQDYQAGDTVTWYAGRNELTTKITSRQTFKDFGEMLAGVGFWNMLPGIVGFREALNEYHKIPGYRNKVQRFGALAFGVEVTDKPVENSSNYGRGAYYNNHRRESYGYRHGR